MLINREIEMVDSNRIVLFLNQVIILVQNHYE
jgi:hypothetical protein